MKPQKLNIITKNDLFGKKQRLIQVKSFTKDDVFYEINAKEKTCTCRDYLKNKIKQPCKHLKLALDLKTNDGFSTSILKSATQKAIRRNEVNKALLSAKSWLHKSPSDFFRRLPIIILEDAILHPEFRRIVELGSLSVRKSFILTEETEFFALTIIEQLAKVEIRDYDFMAFHNGFKSINIIPKTDWEELSKSDRETVMAMMWRAKMGGMSGDIKMLSIYARIWSHRFKEKIITMRKLKKIYADIPTKKNYNDISLKLTVNDILLEAVDFHISPIISILMGKNWVLNLIKNHYPNDVMTAEERIKNIIWKMRSGINYKKDYFTGKAIDWLEKGYNNTPEADYERYETIYKSLIPEINNISIWFLEKNK